MNNNKHPLTKLQMRCWMLVNCEMRGGLVANAMHENVYLFSLAPSIAPSSGHIAQCKNPWLTTQQYSSSDQSTTATDREIHLLAFLDVGCWAKGTHSFICMWPMYTTRGVRHCGTWHGSKVSWWGMSRLEGKQKEPKAKEQNDKLPVKKTDQSSKILLISKQENMDG